MIFQQQKNPTKMTVQFILIVIIIGLAAGILSGLVGVGGGIIMVPALVYFLNYSQHQAQGTSLGVLTLPVVIIASLYYYQQCQKMGTPIDLKVIGILAIGFIIGSYFGSKIAISIETAMLKKIFGALLLFISIKMLTLDILFMKWVKQLI